MLRSYPEKDYLFKEDYELVFIKNYPYRVVDNDHVALYAMPSGTFSYGSAGGARKTVTAYDFGTKPTEPEEKTLKASQKSDAFQKAVAEQKKAADEAQRKRKQESDAKVLEFIKRKAGEGSGSYQVRLAERYLKGDGVPVDEGLAKFWLGCACTNGESTATNMLKELRR